MSFAKYLEGRRRSEAAVERLGVAMSALQIRMADSLVDLLLDLDTTGGSNPKLRSTEANVMRVSEIMRLLKSEMADDMWLEAVGDYVDSFDVMEADIMGYAETLGKVDQQLITALKKHYKVVVAEFLTDPQSFAIDLFNPVQQNIITSIATEGPLKDLNESTRNIIKGTEEAPGAVVDAAKPMAETSATLYERSATSKVADQLGIEIYFYQGRNIDTTRPFCKERAGHAWHKKEIEAWADLDWAGKVDGKDKQTIFVYLGGWFSKRKSCRHVLIPVSGADVPKADIERMVSKGLIAPR
jgi:hypothetical protein